jgi:hypothetical protein
MRTTVDIPERLYRVLERRAASDGVSVESLIVRGLEMGYPVGRRRKGRMVTGPMVELGGRMGPRFPVDENPHDLIFD